jgi:hypothetical protein
MKNSTRQMIKDVLNENAVAFKANAEKALFCKVSKKLDEAYKQVAKNVFSNTTNNKEQQ